MLESGLSGSVRGVLSNGHPLYRDPGSFPDASRDDHEPAAPSDAPLPAAAGREDPSDLPCLDQESGEIAVESQALRVADLRLVLARFAGCFANTPNEPSLCLSPPGWWQIAPQPRHAFVSPNDRQLHGDLVKSAQGSGRPKKAIPNRQLTPGMIRFLPVECLISDGVAS
jgi:hypothetical protein